ncbi:rhamnan synthesis F family protein [Mesorhizobium sp. NBSH29]|uniref:rhamnan synthesis F family protein n=1 Tax=Mesorhizobium sp. NBSH29 TaxID=2654249 RepID=UPI0018965020|nr:rhamnan synthesis F family protein [Mesorhizobium sp. NBSH29]
MTADSSQKVLESARVCFFAHFNAHGEIKLHVRKYLAELRSCGFAIVVISAARLSDEARKDLQSQCDDLIVRENMGLDWGSWQAAYKKYQHIKPKEYLLLCNDSVYGPLRPLSDWLEDLTRTPADVYGAIINWEISPHLQSWFLLLTPKVYEAPFFKGLMNSNMADLSKVEIIARYEVGFGNYCLTQFRAHAAYDPGKSAIQAHTPFNASHLLWDAMLADGSVPFIKRELFRDNPLAIASVNRWKETKDSSGGSIVQLVLDDLGGLPATTSSFQRLKQGFRGKNPPSRPFNMGFVKVDYLTRERPVIQRINYRAYAVINDAFSAFGRFGTKILRRARRS